MATQKTPAAKKVAAPKKPKPTAAERKAAREEAQRVAKAEQEARMAEFNERRPQIFQEMFVKALRIEVIKASYHEVMDTNSWWFNDFSVDARRQSFCIEELGGHTVSQDRMHPSDVERINHSLDMALKWFDEYDAEQERLRQEAIKREQRRQEALSKLTKEDIAALGIRA